MLLALIPAVEQQRYISSLSAELQPSPEEIAETARRGWATSLQELEPGVWACAAGLSLEGQPPMTITVAGPLFRLTQQRRDLIVEKAARTATEVKADWTADIGSPSKAPRQEAG
jgi:DNA-binding IclR family transcriptional regulator